MDAKNNEYSGLTLEEFNNLVDMLNAQNQDFKLGIETIKNSNLYPFLIGLLARKIKLVRRASFLNYFGFNKKQLNFNYLYKEVSNCPDPEARIIFQNTLETIYKSYLLDLTKCFFITSVNLEIKW